MPYSPSSELDQLMDKILGDEKRNFFASIGESLPHTIRFNSLKGNIEKLRSLLEEQGFTLECFPGFNDVFRLINQPFPIGKSLSHFLGHFYVQDIASMLPPRILDPKPEELVLDISAAPGSKTTQMAVLMNNSGMILANDIVQKRLRSLINNLQRLGILNTAVLKSYGESLGNRYFEMFDKILLDPACSGLGTLHKSPEVLSWWTPKHCIRLAASQRSLITSAIKTLKPAGTLVYSTCTLTPEENEDIIQFALDRFPVEVEPIIFSDLITRPGLTEFNGKKYDKQIENARRIYPFENQTEGFFIAKLKKIKKLDPQKYENVRSTISMPFLSDDKSPVKKYLDHLAFHFGIDRKKFSAYQYRFNKEISVLSKEIVAFQFKSKPIRAGLKFAKSMTHIGKLTTEGVHLFGPSASKNFIDLTTLTDLEQFVNRSVMLQMVHGENQVIVKYQGIPIGYGIIENGVLKSQFPKAEWPFRLQ